MFNFWGPSHANGKSENSTFSYMEVYTMNERSVSDYYFIYFKYILSSNIIQECINFLS